MRIINRKNLVMNLLIAAVFITTVILPIFSMFSRVGATPFSESSFTSKSVISSVQ